MRILLIEDEPRVARFIRRGLGEEGHAVDIATDAAEGLALAHVSEYDVIVLDVMLPGRSGFHVASELRSDGDTTPILMLTARDTARDVVRGLDVGADGSRRSNEIGGDRDFCIGLRARASRPRRWTGCSTASTGVRGIGTP